MTIIRFDHVSVRMGNHALLDDVTFTIAPGKRICLIGRNGAGKSTLLKLVESVILPDGGEVWRKPGLRIARLEQDLPPAVGQTVFEVVASGLAEVGQYLAEYHVLTHSEFTDAQLKRMDWLQHEIEAVDGWRFNQKVDAVMTRLQLSPDALMSSLSGGWRKRVALAKALVVEPDILLLDEPTNHLDVEAIEWLEKHLLEFNGTILFITHDRVLLQKLATDIMELDRGNVFYWEGDYTSFLAAREERLSTEEKHADLFDKRLAQEEVWIRQGIKARRTRNEGRVRALEAMRDERAARREQQGKAKLQLEVADHSGKLVMEAVNISQQYGDRLLINNFSTTILRGDRIGLIGKNGSGKSTLLKILLGEIAPDKGEVKRGTKLQVAYFDQLRLGIDVEKTVIDNIAEGRESITINGRQKHIIGYLGDFLFTPDRARTPVRALSGGEVNRVLLARLFSQPANLLVLDEPTNDLDMETLELLEELLIDFSGTVLLVSHDRAFLDKVVTSSIVFAGDGSVREYVGGYEDWIRQGGKWLESLVTPPKEEKPSEIKIEESKTTKKLSYKLQLELSELPAKIESLDKKIAQLQDLISSPDFYQQDQPKVNEKLQALLDAQKALEHAYERWAELDAM
jgi:ATP-binding cassette subfamily F protein uup